MTVVQQKTNLSKLSKMLWILF